jgi:hypothetical protein
VGALVFGDCVPRGGFCLWFGQLRQTMGKVFGNPYIVAAADYSNAHGVVFRIEYVGAMRR